ncbi:MAG: hypothetical protein AB7T38_13910 [Nitrospirales bacterium]
MSSEFFSVIGRQCVKGETEGFQHSRDRSCDGVGTPTGDFGQEAQPRFALHSGDERLLMAFADDGIDLPIPESTATVHHGRAVLNGDAVRQVPRRL